MKSVFTTLVLGLFSLASFSAEVELLDTVSVENHLIQLEKNETATVVIEGETHFSCWKNDQYLKLERGSDIVVLKKPLAHPMVVCDFPLRQVEGTKFAVRNELNFKKFLNLQVPTGLTVTIKSGTDRPRICTAIYAMMYNPDTKECRPASNGCILNELRAVGFEMAGDRCQNR